MKQNVSSAPVPGEKKIIVLAYLGLLFATVTWGMVPVFVKKLLTVLSPTEVSFSRFLLAGALLLIGLVFFNPRGVYRIFQQDFKLLILSTIFGPLTAMVCFNFAIQRISIGTASVFAAVEPVFTYFLAVIVGQEVWRARRMLSILIALGGLSLVTLSRENMSVSYWASLGLAFLSPLVWGANNILSKDLVKRHSPVVLVAISFIISSLFLIPTLTEHYFSTMLHMNTALWLALMYCVMSTLIGFNIWYWTLIHLPPSTVAVSLYIIPVFSIIGGIVFLDETMTLMKAAGVTIVLLGLYLVNVRFQ